MKPIFFALAFAALSSYIPLTAAPKPIPITTPQERIEMLGVSFLPPNEKGWVAIFHHRGKTEIGRLGANEAESFSGMIVLSKCPEVRSPQEFLSVISAQRSRGPKSPRFEDVLNEETLVDEKGAIGVRFHQKYKDYGASNLPKSLHYLIIEDIGIVLQHPLNKNVAVTIALSHRHKLEDASDSFEQMANEFITNANLIPFNLPDKQEEN